MAVLAVLGSLVLGLLGASPVRAVGLTWTVDSPDDIGDANTGTILCQTIEDTCTLRAAIQQANKIDPGAGNHHTIIVPPGIITIVLGTANEDGAFGGDYDLKHSVTIRGSGPASTIIQGSTTDAEDAFDRIFDVQTLGIEVVLENLTIRRGNAHLVAGGGIRVNSAGASLTLRNVVLAENRAFDHLGAAIAARGGPLTILDSRVIDNDAPDAAVIDVDGGSITVRRSSFAGNHVWNGVIHLRGDGTGLIERSTFNDQTTNGAAPASAVQVGANSTDTSEMTVRNSTFANNGGSSSPAIYGQRSVAFRIASTTIAGNDGFGITGSGGTSIRNTILAANDAGNCAEHPTSLGHNLDTGQSCALDGDGDISGGTAALGPLASNGGPTLTRALTNGSDAIDAGDECPGIDQRGVERPKNGDAVGAAVCDIGAYEAPPGTTPAPTPSAAPSAAPSAGSTGAPASAGPSGEPPASTPPGGTNGPGASGGPSGTAGAATPEPTGPPRPTSDLVYGPIPWIILALLAVGVFVAVVIGVRRSREAP